MGAHMGFAAKTIVVMSGKGGVGKSTVAVNLAVWLKGRGKRAGLLDVDLHGPSIPKMLGLEGLTVNGDGKKLFPVDSGGLKVMSVGFLLPDPDSPVIWRGPMKGKVIKQFLNDVDWGGLDYLVIDCPPGTGDEPLCVCQELGASACALIVTTPQDVATLDVRKSIGFCNKLNIPVLGVVENMSGFVCPKCGELVNIFKSGGGEKMSAQMNTRFLGRIPVDPRFAESGDSGVPIVEGARDSLSAKAFNGIFDALV
ncbi:MAG: hypothetical protein A2583_12675 [Bdellovibrionales bacterium RIFOXYD1_FULL_53_11]|nr:MAG: hypothetical protein A2583_12675 [Bdellovibrionales bacterium RIFOXYD1_FULL_53_11]